MSRPDPVALLTTAASHARSAYGRDPWDHGWSVEEYRRSDEAALSGPHGVVTLDRTGVEMLESAVYVLLKQSGIRERWDAEDVWRLIATLVIHAHFSNDVSATIASGIRKLETATSTLVVLPLANTKWSGEPRSLADSVIGTLSPALVECVGRAAGRRHTLQATRAQNWLTRTNSQFQSSPDEPDQHTVLFCSWTKRQGEAATSEVRERFDTLVGLTLLLEQDLYAVGLARGRGNAFRPGIRGLTLHRPALLRFGEELGPELAAQPLTVSDFGQFTPHYWYSEDPYPLSYFFEHSERTDVLGKILHGTDVVSRRLLVSARWYAESHWSFTQDDEVLALGVALDALLGSRAGLPGRAMSERYALLEPDPSLRQKRYKQFGELYQARSATAHGGQSAKLKEPDFVRNMANNVRWAASRLLDLSGRFNPQGEEQLDALFEQLRWGTAIW